MRFATLEMLWPSSLAITICLFQCHSDPYARPFLMLPTHQLQELTSSSRPNISHPVTGTIVTRWWMLFTSHVSGFNVVADWWYTDCNRWSLMHQSIPLITKELRLKRHNTWIVALNFDIKNFVFNNMYYSMWRCTHSDVLQFTSNLKHYYKMLRVQLFRRAYILL